MKQHILLFIFILFVIISYQLFYWKLITGRFLFDSYSSNLGEGFNFLNPYVLEFLFSFRKGWFIYTPIMIFFVFGFYHLYRTNKKIFTPVFIYFLFNFYVICSWSCWWYGISYSSRAIIPVYASLAIPFGYLLTNINFKAKIILFPVLSVLLLFNLFQSWQSAKGILNGSMMTKAYYKSIFLQTTGATDQQRGLLLFDKYSTENNNFTPENLSNKYKKVFSQELSFSDNFENKPNFVDSIYNSKPYSILTNGDFPFSPDIKKVYKEITQKSYLVLKVSGNVFTRNNPNELEAGLVLTLKHKDKSHGFKLFDIRKMSLKQNEWNWVECFMITPDFWDRRDNVQAFFWNLSGKNIYVDDLKIEAFEPLKDESVF